MKSKSEIQMLAPVVLMWLAVACLCVLWAARFSSVSFDSYFGRNPTAALWVSVGLFVSSVTGIWMILTWLVMFGNSYARWLAAPFILCAMTVILGAILRWTAFRELAFDLPDLSRSIVIAGLWCWMLFTLIKYLFGWKVIRHPDAAKDASSWRFSTKQLVALTTLTAIAISSVYWLPEVPPLAVVLFFVGTPCAYLLVLMFVGSRMRFSWLCLFFLAQTIVFAAAITGFYGILDSTSTWLPKAFAACLVAFASIGLFLIGSVTYLRTHGMLFQFGGRSGFGAPAKGNVKLRHRMKMGFFGISASCFIGCGWFIYLDWRFKSWPLPVHPRSQQMAALFEIAVFGSAKQNDVAKRRKRDARTLIEKLGEEAVPYLYSRLKTDDNSDRSLYTFTRAVQLLQRLAQTKCLGVHRESLTKDLLRRIESRSTVLEDQLRAHLLTQLLFDIGMPEAGPAIRILKDKALTPNSGISIGGLGTIVSLIGFSEAEALDVMLQILADGESFDLDFRASVSEQLSHLEIDTSAAQQIVLSLLKESSEATTLGQTYVSSRTIFQILQGLKSVGGATTDTKSMLEGIVKQTETANKKRRRIHTDLDLHRLASELLAQMED